MKRILPLLLAVALLAGCGGGAPAATPAAPKTHSVVIAMGPTSEPEGGFDPAYG